MYADDDGVATPQSQATYNSRIRSLLTVSLILSWIGFGAALYNGQYSLASLESPSIQQWTQHLWPFLFFCSFILYWEHRPIAIYKVGLLESLASMLIVVSNFSVTHSGHGRSFNTQTSTYLQTYIAGLLAIIYLLFPRRPDLYTPEGKPVDGEGSSSALHRYSMNWCTGALVLAGNTKTSFEKLPVLNFQTRSKTQWILGLRMPKTSLWDQILRQRYFGFAKQWTLMVLRSIVTFGSPYCVMRLLSALENGDGRTNGSWIWLVGLGVSSVLHQIIHHHLIWIQWSEMGIPVHAQLIASIFQKVLRTKDVKGTVTASGKPEAVSLISSDAPSLSKFTAVNYIIPSLLVRFLFALLFLVRLLGWKSTLVGTIVTLACIPVHTFVVKQQRVAQRNLTKARDKKTELIVETLGALRQIKFSASETRWERRIDAVRQEEMKYLKQYFMASNMKSVWGVAAPLIVAGSASFAYTCLHDSITSSIIFPMIELLPHLQGTLGFAPFVLQDYFNARSNASRMDGFLRRGEHKSYLTASPSGRVTFRDASIAWPSDSTASSRRFVLSSINLEFPVGELSIITGNTGSGKSLLLAAVIGEADLVAGHISAPSIVDGHPVAYISQTPWLQNRTIKESILFGNEFEKARYEKVLVACALKPDLAALTDGDETVIGVRGSRLSGGQRARLALARGLYSKCELLVIDDIFSSLDAHVCKEILDALTGELATGRTRILATHHVSLSLPKARYIVHLKDSSVEYSGTPEDCSKVLDIAVAAATHSKALSQPSIEQSSTATVAVVPRKKSTASRRASEQKARTDLNVYMGYFAAAGGIAFALSYLTGLVTKQLLSAITTWLLGRLHSVRPKSLSADIDNGLQQQSFVFLFSSLMTIFVEILVNRHAHSGSMRASETLFREMTYRILRMPLLWLDTTPTGEILKRFGADSRMVADSVLATISEFADCFVKLVIVIGIGFYTSKYTIFLTIALLFWCTQLSRDYIKARTTVKHADARPTADILEHLTSSAAGVSTIRAFGAVENAIEQMHYHIDMLSTAKRHFWIFNRWLGLQMSLAGILFSVGTGMILLLSSSDSTTIIQPSLVGFSLTFSTKFADAIFKAVNSFGVLETHMEAAAALLEYAELENEEQGGNDPPRDWPTNGKLEVKGLNVAYSSHSPLVLKNVSFNVEPGKRIGIVGRTGAGKSTLALSLLRLITPRNGTILIDGVDISTIKLASLRSKMTFIPQDPVLFSGTLRSNLDYYGQCSDYILEQALERVKLQGDTEKSSFKLDFMISAGGSNLSQGERQLVCLARALLNKNTIKLIILDEATSAIDSKTETLIKETIMTEFKGTVIVVAHRLSTIVQFDQVMVMSDGRVAEIGEPAELLHAAGGLFSGLVRDSEEKESLLKAILDR